MSSSNKSRRPVTTISDIFWQLHTVNGLALEALGALQDPTEDSREDIIQNQIEACLSALVQAGNELMSIREEASVGTLPF